MVKSVNLLSVVLGLDWVRSRTDHKGKRTSTENNTGFSLRSSDTITLGDSSDTHTPLRPPRMCEYTEKREERRKIIVIITL